MSYKNSLQRLITTSEDNSNFNGAHYFKQNSLSYINKKKPCAIIFCEGNFSKTDGKTANGLVRYSPNFRILSVIDSSKAGLDSGCVLEREKNGIPIYNSLSEAIEKTEEKPDLFIYGIAPSKGLLPKVHREVIVEAISFGLNIVNGLHEYLNDDPELLKMSLDNKVEIFDIRKPKQQNELKTFSGAINKVDCPRIVIMGTDCAIGKRTTATILTNALSTLGLNVVFVSTGQTGIMQGSSYGLVMDAIPAQFCPGELEAVIVRAYTKEKPNIIIIEGQGALSHPAFGTSAMIIKGCSPNAVIIQHAPHRKYRVDFHGMEIPSLESEIDLIEHFARTKVIGISINHEDMNDDEIDEYIYRYSKNFSIPITDALSRSNDFLTHMVFKAFPMLKKHISTIQ